jgi:protein N-terminal amidase
MDLNPLPENLTWPAPCELASFALSNRSQILVILCAWLDSKEDPRSAWDTTTIQFWIERLLPLWSKSSPDLRPMNGMEVPDDHDETIVVICNRSGLERGKMILVVSE